MSYLVVTSRCPISHEIKNGKETVRKNIGGVATALNRAMKQEGGTWVCWGDGNLDRNYPVEEFEGYRIVRVFMTQKEKKGFYDDYANGTLWPLFHYFRDRMKNTTKGFNHYVEMNERFAETVERYSEPDNIIWIHDYQLTLIPAMLRNMGVDNFIIFTWHIPWVASEFYSTLPHAKEILEGIESSDMITFHTDLYRKNFLESSESLSVDHLKFHSKLYTFSLGIDTSYYTPENKGKDTGQLKHKRKIIFSVDRLDYTKGLTNRVLAIEALIKKYPEDLKQFSYVMVVTPSRSSVSEYIKMRRDLEMTVGRINGMHSDLSWQPIIYMYRKVSDDDLMKYYRSADVGLITPLIDGLNLVSKEFVSATTRGVLILSRFAGSAYSLDDALKVNPYDVDEVADNIHYAMNMEENELLSRVNGLKDTVMAYDLNWWLNEIKLTASQKMQEMGKEIGASDINQRL